MAIIVETARLRLRDFEPEDWLQVFPWINDWEICMYQTGGPLNEEQTRVWVAKWEETSREVPRLEFPLAAVLGETDMLVGQVTLGLARSTDRQAWITYGFDPRYRRQGLALEAAKALTGFGFQALELQRLTASVDPENRRSIRLLRKLGMIKIGKCEMQTDLDLYAVDRQSWMTMV
jgi:[ribosomal protein S5]-alanine N-acetyltransferase